MAKSKYKYRYKFVGRTSKLTEECVKKLEEAAAVGASVEEMCFYANISTVTYYAWIKNDQSLLNRFTELREKLPLAARYNIAKRIHGEPTNGDIGLSRWLLERAKPEEFGETLKLKHSGSVGQTDDSNPEDEALRLEFKERLKANIHKRWDEKEKTKKHENNIRKPTNS